MLVKIIELCFLLMIATFIFDVLHYTLHQCYKSKRGFLKKIGTLHEAHHLSFDRTLKINEHFIFKNIIFHIIPEYLTQLLVTSVFFLFFDRSIVLIAMGLETLSFLVTVLKKGKDHHHQPRELVHSFSKGIQVDANYHALHHIFPYSCFGSYTKIIDYILGTATPLKNRRVVITGSRGALGSAMRDQLEKEGAIIHACAYFGKDYHYKDYSQLSSALEQCDILVLCHGSKEAPIDANYHSFKAIINLFVNLSKEKQVPPEIWAVGSEAECHPMFGKKNVAYGQSKRKFAAFAKKCCQDKRIIYRHIVPSAFTSSMGRGLMSGSFAARYALFLIKRGCCYIPATYTGIAFINYIYFRFFLRAENPAFS